MAHGSHGAHIDTANERALKISAVLNGVYFVIELIAGLLIGSVAVISDAFHAFSAVGRVLIALLAASSSSAQGSRGTTAERFGYWAAVPLLPTRPPQTSRIAAVSSSGRSDPIKIRLPDASTSWTPRSPFRL